MGEHDLHVKHAGDRVREQQPPGSERPRRLRERHRAHPNEKEQDAEELSFGVVVLVVATQNVDETLSIQIDAPQSHERVEEEMLVRYQKACQRIHTDALLVVRVPEAGLRKDLLRDGEHRHMLDVRVMLNGVAHDVVSVVVRLPPPHGEAHQSGEDRANQVVQVEVVRDARMPQVVAEARHLLPADAEHRGAAQPCPAAATTNAASRQAKSTEEEESEPANELGIVAVVSLEKAAAQQLLPNRAKIGDMWVDDHVRDLADKKLW
mmetsp:Transcript_45828/g.106951  ORF Transcript_45828/g.106951 Transcript_45828/m.106951 type:complete len:264 (+) Transcript_45828:366-1157(+)